jgi:hypothetical protein
VNRELVRSPEEDFRGQVPTQLAAQGTLNGDGLKGEFLRSGGNIPVTVFAGDDELLAFLHHEPHERIIMSEIIDKAYMGVLAGSFEHCAMVSPDPFRCGARRPVGAR